MRKRNSGWLCLLMLAVFAMGATFLDGCHKKVVAGEVQTQVLPPGAVDQLDATAFRVLSDTQAAIDSIKGDIASGKHTPSEYERKVLNQVIIDYNVALPLAQSYHATRTQDTVALSQAITQLVKDIADVVSAVKPQPK